MVYLVTTEIEKSLEQSTGLAAMAYLVLTPCLQGGQALGWQGLMQGCVQPLGRG